LVLANNLRTYFGLVFALRGFLKETLSLEQCKEIVKRRLEEREKNFIEVAKRTIYENEKSPYLKLLKHAGCEFGDFRSSILREGIEKTLEGLRASGVYLTYDEFKGRREVIRGGKSFRFEQSDFNNPILSHHLTIQTGGTTGKGVAVPVDFGFIAQTAVHRSLLFDIYNLWDTPFALWFPILPGMAGVSHLLHSIKAGKVPSKWFSQTDREYMRPSFRHKLRTNGLIYAGRLFGTGFPKPEFVDLNSAVRVVIWAAQTLKEYSGCCVATYPSSAVRICHAAKEAGLIIEGMKFILGGEPITPVKEKEIKSVGARIISQYAFSEAGVLGFGCAEPVHADEVHFFRDSFAIIQHQRSVPAANVTRNFFLFTSLLPRFSKVLLNVEIGDHGMIASRKCGCGFEKIGFTDHIHSIKNIDKISSEGMSLSGADITRVVEHILPLNYGGDSTDYQIIEEEDEEGFTRLSIIISPEVGSIEENELLRIVLCNLKNSFVPDILSQASTLCVKRTYPIPTEMGKILPFYVKRSDKST
jgi:hypothetical protein